MKRKTDPWLPTRHTLIARLKDKSDDRSWQEFFDLYARLIYSVATQSGLSHVEAEDVVQETVLSVAKKIDQFKADPSVGSFKSWLRQLIQWRIRDQVRKRRPEEIHRAHRPPGEAGQAGSSTATEERLEDPSAGHFEEMWDREWREQAKQMAIERLKRKSNPRHYQIFQMHVFEGHSVREVATAFEITEAQVHLIKHRLLESLKEESAELQEQLK